MKVLVLASGGDAAGTNKFIATLYKKFGKNLYACRGGFWGLYKNDIVPASYFEPLKYQDAAGCCIKTTRFPNFKEKQYFSVALKNALNYDALVVIGGNGTKQGARALADNGARVVFVPGTIDNDVEDSDYSMGFHTAVKAVCEAVRNVMPSMESHTRSCIFETMGRHCGKIAQTAAQIIQPEAVITEKKELNENKLSKVIKERFEKGMSTTIIMRENVCDSRALSAKLSEKLAPIEVRTFVVGHLQRGSKPSKQELTIATRFAKGTIKAIGTDALPIAVMLQDGKTILKKI